MEKSVQLFWRYFGAILVLLEVCVYILAFKTPFPWQVIRIGFLLVNLFIIAYLVQVKLKVHKHNAQVNAAYQANKPQIRKSHKPAA